MVSVLRDKHSIPAVKWKEIEKGFVEDLAGEG